MQWEEDEVGSWFATNLRAARRKLGLTQAELAAQVALSTISIRHMEKSINRPSFTSLIALANALGMSPAKLISPPK